MTICVVGLGYVGLPLAIQFARSGAKVTGLDIDRNKVDQVNRGFFTRAGRSRKPTQRRSHHSQDSWRLYPGVSEKGNGALLDRDQAARTAVILSSSRSSQAPGKYFSQRQHRVG